MPESCTIDGPAGLLEAQLRVPQGDEPPGRAVLLAHPHPLYGGTMHNAVVQTAARWILGAGSAALCFNFRGVGASSGTHDDGRGEQEDLAACDEWLRERFPEAEVWWLGYSFGAAVIASRLAALNEQAAADATPPSGALLLAPPLTMRDFSLLSEISTPLSLVTGTDDDLTPRGELDRAGAWPSLQRHVEIDGAGHDLGVGDRAAFEAALQNAFGSLLARGD